MFVPAKRKKPWMKPVYRVVIREISMRTSGGLVSILKTFQFHAIKKRILTNDEHPFSDISSLLDFSPLELS
jgi:hypothetical protein